MTHHSVDARLVSCARLYDHIKPVL